MCVPARLAYVRSTIADRYSPCSWQRRSCRRISRSWRRRWIKCRRGSRSAVVCCVCCTELYLLPGDLVLCICVLTLHFTCNTNLLISIHPSSIVLVQLYFQ